MERVSQTGVRERVAGILFDRALKELDALADRLSGALVPVVTPFQVEVVSLGVLRVTPGEPLFLFARELQAQRLGNLARDPLLHREGVRELLLESFSPHLRSALDVSQLRLDDEAVALLQDAARQDRSNSEVPTRLQRILSLVNKDCRRRKNAELRQLREAEIGRASCRE